MAKAIKNPNMILLFLSDIHSTINNPQARIDNVELAVDRKLTDVFDWAEKWNAIVVGSGDLGDSPRSWHTLWKLLDMSKRWKRRPLMYQVYGQHDFYMRSKESKRASVLGILEAAGVIKVLGEEPITHPRVGIKDKPSVHIYGCGYGEKVPKPGYKTDKDINVLAIHKMVLSKKIWARQKEYEFAPDFLRKYKDYDFIVCGDYHYKFLYYTADGRTILNTGCMLRKTAGVNDMAHRPGFFVHNTDWERGRVRWHPIPHEPAKKVLTREHIEAKEEVSEAMKLFASTVVKAKKKKSKRIRYKDGLIDFMDVNKSRKPVREFTLMSLDRRK